MSTSDNENEDVDRDELGGGRGAEESSGNGLTMRRRDYLTGCVTLASIAGYAYYGNGQEMAQRLAPTADDDAMSEVDPGSPIPILNGDRPGAVAAFREQSANRVRDAGVVDHPVETQSFEGNLGRFTKGLEHDDVLRVSDETYDSLVTALLSGDVDALTDINRGGERRLIDPLGSYTMPIMGMDSHEVAIDPPPALNSDQTGAEMAELYWMSLLRDVPFSEYPSNDLAQAAARDLSQFDSLEAPRNRSGDITPELLFRGNLPGSEVGPYQSQFFLKDCPWGAHEMSQQIEVAEPGVDFLTDRNEFQAIYSGRLPDEEKPIADERSYMVTGRHISSCVHRDVVPGQMFIAANILIGEPIDGVPADQPALFDSRNPYPSPAAHSFVNHARTQFMDLMSRAARTALMAVWFQKWQVHRRARPEKVAGLLDLHMTGRARYPDAIPDNLLNSAVLPEIRQRQGNHLLSQAYAEGCPTHPSYPGGHATVAAAAGTVMKAMFNEDHVIEDPVVPTPDGQSLEPYEGDEELTVGGEINKLIDNINLGGRHMAGVHYRSDTHAAYELGEQVAIRLLEDVKEQSVEAPGWQFTGFDGETRTI